MRLPQELITAIISEIPNVQTEHDAKDTLSACCLVAQSFLHSSRQKLWSHLTLPDPSENYLSDLYDTLLSSDTLPALVRTLSFECCDQDPDQTQFFIKLLALFPNVNHVILSGLLDRLPEEVNEYMVSSWKLTTATFNEITFYDVGEDLCSSFLPRLSGLKDIRFVATSGPHMDENDLEDLEAENDWPLSEPESLYLDMTPSGVSIAHLLLRDEPVLFSLTNVKRLTLSFNTDEGDADHIEDIMHHLLSKVSNPLDELVFRSPDALSLDEGAELISISSIRRVSFAIITDYKPSETAAWWVKNIDNALDTDIEGWAIEEVEVNIIFYRWNAKSEFFEDMGESWEDLDRVLAKAAERTKRVKIAAQSCRDVVLESAEKCWHTLRADSFVRCSGKTNVLFGQLQEIEFYL